MRLRLLVLYAIWRFGVAFLERDTLWELLENSVECFTDVLDESRELEDVPDCLEGFVWLYDNNPGVSGERRRSWWQ